MLTLEVELLTGVYRAALPDGTGVEWPPHPERVFSALAQAWGDGGEDRSEREALEWLEALLPPTIEASETLGERTAPKVFVPPNDPRGNELEVMPERRRRQERFFFATTPLSPLTQSDGGDIHFRLAWEEEPEATMLNALMALAHRVASIGHSSSLVRLKFQTDRAARIEARIYRPVAGGDLPIRSIYGGRLSDLTRWYSTTGGKKVERPRSLDSVRYRSPGASLITPPSATVFGGEQQWFVFERNEGGEESPNLEHSDFAPDLLAFPRVARCLRDALMRMDPKWSPEIICGHKADGSASELPHLTIVPLANVGWRYSTGDLVGLAIVLPRTVSDEDRTWVMKAVLAWKNRGGVLHLGKGCTWRLSRAPIPKRASLKPRRWCARSSRWASVTPVFLDRFPKTGNPLEEIEIIVQACKNINLPEPSEIEIHKHSTLEGAPSAYPARGKSSLPDWSFPAGARYSDRPRRHVVLKFDRDVEGPILLGAGRYHGLGLFLPLEEGTVPSGAQKRGAS